MNFRNAIVDFLNKMGYLENKNCEGIVFYGSYSTGFYNDKSDIDLHIIFNNDNPEIIIRGIDTIDGFRIEYFEKPLDDLYGRAINDFNNQSNVLLSMIGHGKVLFDRNGEIKKLQNYILKLYSVQLSGLSDNEIYEQIAIINNRMIDLERLGLINDDYFIHLYHLTVEKIRKFYYRKNGLPEIPTSKVLDFYKDDTYSNTIFKVTPPLEFIQLYYNCLDESKSNSERLNIIKDLYNYVKDDYYLDPERSRILIKSRNKK